MQKVSTHVLVSGICDVLQQRWRFHVRIFGSDDVSTFNFLDGDATFYKDVKWYVEEHVYERPFEKERANQVRLQIEEYRDRLWEGFKDAMLSGGPQPPTTLVIEVQESANAAPSSFRILWELLEDKVRDREIQCLVTRALAPTGAEHYPATPPIVGSNVLKILLVVSRSFAPVEEDVNHQIISKPLFDMIKDKSIRDLVVIQMVRPGTFESLQEHLEAQGEGYFDLVHFDVHGRVYADDAQKKRVVLRFSDLCHGSDERDAETVGKLLKRYGVRAVILNACESAQVDANLALSFVDAGLDFVIASSFVLHVTAATLFLKAFYEAFLLKGLDVSTATAAGRSVLSSHRDRKARFLSTVTVNDHFVPVIYQRAGLKLAEVKFAHPVNCVAAPPADSTEINNDSSIHCMGRQLDILFLEAILLKDSPVVELSGFSGVGKTALLWYLCRWWTDSDFIEKAFFLDLATFSSLDPLRGICRSILDFLGASLSILDEELIAFTAKKLSASAPRKHILVCFDNTEHAEARVASAARELLAQLHGDSQTIGIITSSLRAGTENNDKEFSTYRLDGLTLRVAAEYALGFAGNTEVIAGSRRQPENFEASLLLLNGIPLAIQSVICSMVLNPPTSFAATCKTLLSGTIPLEKGFPLSRTRNFQNVQGLVNKAGPFEKTILTLLSLFTSRWPHSLRLLLSHAVCANDKMAPFIDMDLLCRTSEFTELAVGESLSFESAAQVYDSRILDQAFFQKADEIYQKLMIQLQTWSMILAENEEVIVHPLLAQCLRTTLYDKMGPEDSLKVLEIFGIYHYDLFRRQMDSMIDRNFNGTNSLAFLCDDRHNFLAALFRPLFSPLSRDARVDFFLANISVELLAALNQERIYGHFGPDRVILDLLWHEIFERYEEFKGRVSQASEGPIAQLALEAALEVSIAECSYKARWSKWSELPISLARTWDILQDSMHTNSEEWTIDSYLGLIKFHMLVGQQRGAQGDLEQSISSHQDAERNIELLVQKLSTQDWPPYSPQHIFLYQVMNTRAINRGLLLNAKKCQVSKIKTTRDDEGQQQEYRALYDQLAKDWKAVAELPGLAKYTRSEVKRKGDWILRSKKIAMDSSDFLEDLRDDAVTETKDLVSQWQQDSLKRIHIIAKDYEAYSKVLLDELEQARNLRPVDWLTIAGIHDELSVIARHRGEQLDTLFHVDEAVRSYQNVNESQVIHYWDRLAYMLFVHATSAIKAQKMDMAYTKCAACLEICQTRKSGRWGLRVLEISIIHLLIAFLTSETGELESWKLSLWLLDLQYKEEIVVKRLISQLDFTLEDLPQGRDWGFQDYSLRIGGVGPHKVSDLEAVIFEQFEGHVGKNFREILMAFTYHFELRERINQELASTLGISAMQVTVFMGTVYTLLQMVPESEIMDVFAEAETVLFGSAILLSKRQSRIKYFYGTLEASQGLRSAGMDSYIPIWMFIWHTPRLGALLDDIIAKKRQSLKKLYGRRRAAKLIATKPMNTQTIGLILDAPDDDEQSSSSEGGEGIVSRIKSSAATSF